MKERGISLRGQKVFEEEKQKGVVVEAGRVEPKKKRVLGDFDKK